MPPRYTLTTLTRAPSRASHKTPTLTLPRTLIRTLTRGASHLLLAGAVAACSLGAETPPPQAEAPPTTPTRSPLLPPPTPTPLPAGATPAPPPPAAPVTTYSLCGPDSASAPIPTTAAADPAGEGDWSVNGGWFYTQGAGPDGGGYAIVDDAQARFWTQFQDLGGWRTLGFPVSRRFMLDGKLSQVTQRALLQWSPTSGRVELSSVLDLLHERQRDGALQRQHQIPPPTSVDQVNRSYDAVVAQRLAWLEARPAIKRQYCNAPGGADPIALWGLPTSEATDVSGGSVYVLRTQRAAFQEWADGLEVGGAQIAPPGGVTVVLAGDLAKSFSLVPCTALTPEATERNPAPATPAPGAILLCEEFDDPARGLLPGPPSPDPDHYALGYEGGEYLIRKVDPAWDRLPNAALPGVFGDASLGVDVRLTGTDARARYVALACRDTPEAGHYRLVLEPEARRFRLSRVAPDGQSRVLADWQTADAIRAGTQTNRVRLSCAGDRIGATVNDVPLIAVEDTGGALPPGRLWIGASSYPDAGVTAEARFDGLVVRQEPPPPPPPSPSG